MKSREEKIEELCDGVLTTPTRDVGDAGTGTVCPFCGTMANKHHDHISEINHDEDCVYLIAQDLHYNA